MNNIKIRHIILLIKWFKFGFCYNKWPNPSNSQNYCGVCCVGMFVCLSHIHPLNHNHAFWPLHNYRLLCLTTSFCSVPEHCRDREREGGDGSAICPVSVGIVIKRAYCNVVIILTWQRSLPFIETHETLWQMNLCCHDVKNNETGSEQKPHNELAWPVT